MKEVTFKRPNTHAPRGGVKPMKGEHVELLTGILIGTVIGGMYAAHLATYVPLLVVILAVSFGVKLLGLK